MCRDRCTWDGPGPHSRPGYVEAMACLQTHALLNCRYLKNWFQLIEIREGYLSRTERKTQRSQWPGRLDDTLHQEWTVLGVRQQRAWPLRSGTLWGDSGHRAVFGSSCSFLPSQLTVSPAVPVSFEFFHLVANDALGRDICCMANTSVSKWRCILGRVVRRDILIPL